MVRNTHGLTIVGEMFIIKLRFGTVRAESLQMRVPKTVHQLVSEVNRNTRSRNRKDYKKVTHQNSLKFVSTSRPHVMLERKIPNRRCASDVIIYAGVK